MHPCLQWLSGLVEPQDHTVQDSSLHEVLLPFCPSSRRLRVDQSQLAVKNQRPTQKLPNQSDYVSPLGNALAFYHCLLILYVDGASHVSFLLLYCIVILNLS